MRKITEICSKVKVTKMAINCDTNYNYFGGINIWYTTKNVENLNGCI